MIIELTNSEAATLKSCLEGALIDAKGLSAIVSGEAETKVLKKVADIKALLKKVSKN